jgi:tRNA threonylcarbamoyladenosine biosynthesis protein TsaB
MRILVIDTATKACSVALFNDGELFASDYDVIGRGHAERLLPMIQQLPDMGRADQIWVNAGPGSFTGIRVGISAARALALAWEIPCNGYSNLQLIAAMADANGPVDVAINGGHGEMFFQSFDENSAPITDLRSLSPNDAATASHAAIIAGDGAEHIVSMRGSAVAAPMLPDARQWILIADMPPLPPTPIYGRAPDAKLPAARQQL